MRTIRYFAALLLILTAVLHALPFFKVPQDSHALPMLAFGIVYFTIGILLIMNMKIASALGIIFPLIGIGAVFFVIGLPHVSTMLAILFAIGLLVVLCCAALFYQKTK
ncbi:MAG: hypothetical protein NT004_04305 [Bacteroidetes bacterium]|nr:hypothetical protein [Bacteroidota bacterium]